MNKILLIIIITSFPILCYSQVQGIKDYEETKENLANKIDRRITRLEDYIKLIANKNTEDIKQKIKDASKLFVPNSIIETISLRNTAKRDTYPNAKAYFRHLAKLAKEEYESIEVNFDDFDKTKFVERAGNELYFEAKIHQYFWGKKKGVEYYDLTKKVVTIVAFRKDKNSDWNIKFKSLIVDSVEKRRYKKKSL